MDGLLTVGFGLALIAVPAAGLLVWMIGGFKLASGLLLLVWAFRLRKEERGATGAHFTNLAGAGR